jgi:predicted small lipoprotein YifL
MKTILTGLVMALAAVFSLAAQAGLKGPIVDAIVFDARTQEEAGVKDVAMASLTVP